MPPRAIRPTRRPRLSGINLRRWQLFKANGRGFHSTWIFLFLFVFSLFAEFIANDRPIMASYKGELLFPIFAEYPETKFGGFLAQTDFRDPFIQEESPPTAGCCGRRSATTTALGQLRTAEPRALAARPSR
jgi:hypothetical protein